MNKTIFIFTFLIIGLLCALQAEQTAVINYTPGYYSPFAWSMRWHFEYQGDLEKNKKVKIVFILKKSGKLVDLPSWEHILGISQKVCDIYFFVQNDPSGKCTIRMDVVPCERFSNSWTFNHKIKTSYDFIYATYPQIRLSDGKEALLAKFHEQYQGENNDLCSDMLCNKITTLQIISKNGKEENFLSGEIFCQFTVIDIATPKQNVLVDPRLLPGMADAEILQLKNKLMKDFENGHGSLQTLNAVQMEINKRKMAVKKE